MLPDFLIGTPSIRLLGGVDNAMVNTFLAGLDALRGNPENDPTAPITVEVMTEGGNADSALRIADEVRIAREYHGTDLYFIGRTFVYSAGITIMSGFPVDRRYLSRDTVLLIHGRRVDKQVHFTGPLGGSIRVARELQAEFENGERLERRGFEWLVEGSDVSLDELCELAGTNWYVSAEEAVSRRLVAGLI